MPPLLLPLLLSLLLCRASAQSQPVVYHGPTASPPPIPREGAVFGSEVVSSSAQAVDLFFAGGVNLLLPSTASFTAFADIWVYNVSNSSYQQAEASLPSPVYFSAGGYSAAHHSLFIFSGRNNSAGNGLSNSYFTGLIAVDWSAYWNGQGGTAYTPVVSQLPLSAAVTGRQHAGSLLLNETLYVLNGMTGLTGQQQPADAFWAISCVSGQASALSQAASFPYQSAITPTLFSNTAGSFLYVYSGLMPDSATFVSPLLTYVYSIAADRWLPPLRSLTSAFQPNAALPNVAFAAQLSVLNLAYIMDGGCNGSSGSTSQLAALVPPNGSAPLASPELITLYFDGNDEFSDQPVGGSLSGLLTPRQSGMVGLSLQIVPNVSLALTVWWYGGAQYSSSIPGQLPIGYQSNTTVLSIQIAWADLEDQPQPAAPQSGSSSSVNKGAIAGGVVGGVVGLSLLLLLLLLCRSRGWCRRAPGKQPHSHSSAASESSSMSDAVHSDSPAVTEMA